MEKLAEEVRHAFVYSADGKLLWQNPSKYHTEKRLSVAGGINPKGYWIIGFNGKRYRRSQLVFLYHYGFMPQPVCDHKNRIRDDDRIENLRELSIADNNRNNSKRNITLRPNGKYQVRRSGKHIGMFDTLNEARSAYDRIKNEV